MNKKVIQDQVDPQQISQIGFQMSLDKTRSDFKALDMEIRRLCKEDFQVIESKEDHNKKEIAIGKITEIINAWMSQINDTLGYNKQSSGNQARVLCFGSYKLGVSSPNGDVDAIVLVPFYVDREKHFFGKLFEMLQDYARHNSNIKHLQAVNTQTAVTPLIAMNFYEVEIDLLFVSMDNLQQFDGEILEGGLSKRPNLYNDLLMDHMDEKMKRSFNGFRNAEMILESIILPEDYENKSNIKKKLDVFRLFVIALKVFHKKKGIYENKMGYFGGITLALMAAKIIQLYPNYSVAHLLERFFYVYGHIWSWAENPVQIVPEKKNPSDNKNALNYKDQINFSDDIVFSKKKRYIEVMTPAWPQMSSTFNVGFSNKKAIINAYQKEHQNLTQILNGFLEQGESSDFKTQISSVFKEQNFFQEFPQYLELCIVGNDQNKFNNWAGFVESKIRLLAERLDQLYCVYNVDIRLVPKVFQKDYPKMKYVEGSLINDFQFCNRIFMGLEIWSEFPLNVDLAQILSNFVYQIEIGWNSENQFRNSKMIDVYFYIRSQAELQTNEERKMSLEIELSEKSNIVQEQRDLVDFLLE